MANAFKEEEHAQLYVKYRPRYPEYIYESIIDYCRAGNRTFTFDLAVDVACGSGQGTLPLCKYFKSVVGIDTSEQQIAAVDMSIDIGKYSNVTFSVGKAEDTVEYRCAVRAFDRRAKIPYCMTFLANNSVDLITIAAALHWVPLDLFYAEVKRVLKPNGVFITYGYDLPVLLTPDAEQLNYEFTHDLIGDYWSHINDRTSPPTPPFPNCERRDGERVSIHCQLHMDSYIGYMSTYSAWRAYLARHPDSDALQILRNRLHKIYGQEAGKDKPLLSVTWPGFMLLARKPC